MKTILVIDEDKMMRENTTEILELSHYRVISEGNYTKGLELAKDNHPDMIICDNLIPKMQGVELLKKVRHTAGLDKIPFILITAPGENRDKNNGATDGASEYLDKPFEGEELLRVVARVSCRKRIITRNYMPKKSAGILPFRIKNQVLEVLLMHPGGPFWNEKDAGAWSIPKGEIEENEASWMGEKRI